MTYEEYKQKYKTPSNTQPDNKVTTYQDYVNKYKTPQTTNANNTAQLNVYNTLLNATNVSTYDAMQPQAPNANKNIENVRLSNIPQRNINTFNQLAITKQNELKKNTENNKIIEDIQYKAWASQPAENAIYKNYGLTNGDVDSLDKLNMKYYGKSGSADAKENYIRDYIWTKKQLYSERTGKEYGKAPSLAEYIKDVENYEAEKDKTFKGKIENIAQKTGQTIKTMANASTSRVTDIYDSITKPDFRMPLNIKNITSYNSESVQANIAMGQLELWASTYATKGEAKQIMDNLIAQLKNNTYQGTDKDVEKVIEQVKTIIANENKTTWANDLYAKTLRENEYRYTKTGKKIVNALGVASEQLPTLALGLSGGAPASTFGIYTGAEGSAYKQALNEGATDTEAKNYARGVALAETGIETLAGGVTNKVLGIPGFINMTSNITNPYIRGFVNYTGDVLGESFEEGISGVIEPYIRRATYDPNAGFENFGEALTAFTNNYIESILPTMLMSAGTNIVNTTQMARVKKEVDDYYNEFENVIKASNLTETQKQKAINEVEKAKNKVLKQAFNQDENLQNTTQNSTNLAQTSPNTANISQNNVQNVSNLENTVQSEQSLGIQQNKEIPQVIQTFVENRNKIAPGLNIQFDNTLNTDGRIIRNPDGTRTISINPNSTRAYEFVVVHEMMHDLENTPEFQELSKYVKDRAITHEEFEKAKQAITEQYTKYYTENNLDMSGLNMDVETTNDMVAQALGNQQFLNELAGNKPNVFMRLYNWIKNVAFDGNKTGKTFAERRADNKYLQELKTKFETAYNTAYKQNSSNEQYSIQTRADGTKYVRVDTDQNIFDGIDKKDYTKIARMYMQDYLKGETKLGNTSVAKIGSKGIKKYTDLTQNTKYLEEKMQLTPELKNILEVAQKVNNALPTKVQSKYPNWEYYRVNFEIDGVPFEGLINIGIDKNGNKEFYEINKIRITSNSSFSTSKSSNTNLINNSIPSNNNIVNNQYMQNSSNNTQNSTQSSFSLPKTSENYIRLYRGLYNKYDANYDRSKLDNVNGYESWTDNYELAKQYGENVYYIDVPLSKVGNDIMDQDGERFLVYKNDKPVALNNIPGNEYMLYTGHDDFENIQYNETTQNNNLPKTDNQGRELTKEQQEYFKDSKVRDKEGRLLEVYHGTEANWFYTFDADKQGAHGSILGNGFYFTSDFNSAKEYAHSKGNVYSVYLNIKKPFRLDLSSDKGFFEQLEELAENTDYKPLMQGSEFQIGERIKELLKGKGYDGIILGDIYVVFESNQIKNVDNTNPTENPDIRYTQSNNEWQKYLDKNWNLMPNSTKTDFAFPTAEQLNTTKEAEEAYNTLNMKKPKLERIADLTEKDAELLEVNYDALKSKDKGKERKFTENVKTSKIISKEIQDKIEVSTYEVKNNLDTLAKMKEKLDTEGNILISKWDKKAIKDFTDEDIALGAILIERYQQKAGELRTEGKTKEAQDMMESAIDAVEKLRDVGTEKGRAVQMYAIFQRLTPEGMMLYQSRKIENAFKELSQKQTGKWVEQNREKFKLTADDATFITAKVQEAQNAPTARQKQIALAEIEKRINDKLPPEAGQSVKAFRRIAMLFNPKTQVRNIAGNTTVMPLNYVTDVVATGIDKIIAKKTGIRTTALPNIKIIAEGAKKGLSETIDDYKRGIRTTPTGSKYEIQNNAKSFNENTNSKVKNAINKKLNSIDRILSSVMEAGDRPFYEAAYQNSLQGQMKANGVTEPTQEMIDVASNVGMSQTWQDNNNYTQAVLGIRSAFNKININGFGLGDLIIPFAKTPANLTKAMVDYSPAGFIPALINYNDMRKAISRGDMTAMQQKKFVTSVGKAVAGTLLYVLAGALVKGGKITGSADEDKDVANFEKNVLGIQPYSMKIGDKTFTYNWAQPLATPLAIMSDTYKMSEEGAKWNEILVNAFKVAGDQLVANSFLQGIQELLSSEYGNESAMDNLVGAIMDLPTQFTPTLLGQIATQFDSTKRQTFENGDSVGTMVNEVKNKIPGAKNTLAQQVNTFGEEIQNYGGDNNPFNVFLNPGNISSTNATDTQKELYALYEVTKDKTIFPKQAPYSVSGGGEKVTLSSQDRAEYQKTSGQYVTEQLDALFNSKFYKSLEDGKKADVVAKIVGDADTTAKDKWIDTETTERLAELKTDLEESGIPLLDYYNAWIATQGITSTKKTNWLGQEYTEKTESENKKEAIDKATPDLDKWERRKLYEIFNVGKSVW